jgi:hypothetical protein
MRGQVGYWAHSDALSESRAAIFEGEWQGCTCCVESAGRDRFCLQIQPNGSDQAQWVSGGLERGG